MLIKLDMSSDVPIYLQLRNQIILGIGSGSIKIGQRLPTVRALAAEIGINTMTVNKTYAILKREGFIDIDRRHGAKIADISTVISKSDAHSDDAQQRESSKTDFSFIDEQRDKAENLASNEDLLHKETTHHSDDSKSKTRRVLSQLLSSGRVDGKDAHLQKGELIESAGKIPANLDSSHQENLLLLLCEATLKGAKKDELLALCNKLISEINISS